MNITSRRLLIDPSNVNSLNVQPTKRMLFKIKTDNAVITGQDKTCVALSVLPLGTSLPIKFSGLDSVCEH